MNRKELDVFLFSHTKNELAYLKKERPYSNRYQSAPRMFKDGKEVLILDVNNLEEEKIILRKDSRYTFIPFFTYPHINLNYIYSGECTYWIDDREIHLSKGDICIFDKGVIRTKPPFQYHDIVINITISDSFFQESIAHLKKHNIISAFLINHISTTSDNNNFIIFHTQESELIEALFVRLLEEYFQPQLYSKEIILHYFSIIMMELLRLYDLHSERHLVQLSDKKSETLMDMLAYIEKKYQCCTLKDLSKEFGYHPNYISNYLKRYTGKSLKQIQSDYRLDRAQFLLLNTSESIDKICEQLGFTNRSVFYQKFHQKYNLTPKEYRNAYKV